MQRYFLYMPFMHSEDLLAAGGIGALFNGAGESGWREVGRAIITILSSASGVSLIATPFSGARSTPEELEFLKTEPPFA